MRTRIEDIVYSVKYGPHLTTMKAGDIKYLKGNHFNEDNELNDFSNSYVSLDGQAHRFLLEESDLILAAKGFRNFAWAYDSRYGRCIASSIFYVIKVDPKLVLSQYLALYLNTPRYQHKLRLRGLGATTPSILKKELLLLKVEIPPLAEQERIVKINKLMQKQIELEKKIIEKQKSLKTGLIDLITTK